MTLTCHPEAQPKDLANEKEILRFAQNDSFAVTLGTFHFSHFKLLRVLVPWWQKVFRSFRMAEEEKKQEKKIIVDEDWKQQAQKEKEILAAQEEAEKQEVQEQRQARGPLPKGNFAALISMLTTQALFALGLLQVKGQEKREPDLQLAKYNIDMLETLEEKTKGNLTEEEQKLFNNTLNELRMGYVKVAELITSQSQ